MESLEKAVELLRRLGRRRVPESSCRRLSRVAKRGLLLFLSQKITRIMVENYSPFFCSAVLKEVGNEGVLHIRSRLGQI